jgi:hypothetical protein
MAGVCYQTRFNNSRCSLSIAFTLLESSRIYLLLSTFFGLVAIFHRPYSIIP